MQKGKGRSKKLQGTTSTECLRVDLTQSSINAFQWCNRRYYWRYVMGWSPKGTDRNMQIGELFHAGLESIRSTKAKLPARLKTANRFMLTKVNGTPTDEYLIACFILEWHARTWIDEGFKYLAVEPVFSLGLGPNDTGPFLAGKIDAIVQDDQRATWIVESKSTYKIDDQYLSKLPLDRQITIYLLGAIEALNFQVQGCIYDVACRPRIHIRTGETILQWLERASADYLAMPTSFFARQKCIRKLTDIEEIKLDCLEIWRQIQECHRRKMWLQNTAVCFVRGRECPYTDLCIHGPKSMIVAKFESRRPFEELRK